MNTIFLTSCLNLYDKDENDNKIPHVLGNEFDILDNFKKHIKKYDNFLMIASDEFNYELTDSYAIPTIESFKLSLPFETYTVLDGRNSEQAKVLVEKADFIYLCGGHVPTQLKFFDKINLTNLIKHTDAVICGISAGSMNCADIVYCPPELEGESIDPNFQKYLKGLNLTDINILPHFDTLQEFIIDDKDYIKDIIIPDSYKTKILALNDKDYVLITNQKISLYGNPFKIHKGTINKISDFQDF